jgi:hypothetical protein
MKVIMFDHFLFQRTLRRRPLWLAFISESIIWPRTTAGWPFKSLDWWIHFRGSGPVPQGLSGEVNLQWGGQDKNRREGYRVTFSDGKKQKRPTRGGPF